MRLTGQRQHRRDRRIDPTRYGFTIGIICIRNDARVLWSCSMQFVKIAPIVCDYCPIELRCPVKYIGIFDSLIRTAILLHSQNVVAQRSQCLSNQRGNMFIRIEVCHPSPREPMA